MIEHTIATTDNLYQVDTVLIKVAGRCNINCNYCYVFNMGDQGWRNLPNVISNETVEHIGKVLEDLLQKQTSPIAVVLHGGEPLLLGAKRLDEILSVLRGYISDNSTISIQTNGTLITNEILDVCSRHKTSISVSLDGPEYLNDRNRVGFDNSGTYQNAVNGIRLLQAHKDSDFLFSGVLAVIDPESNPVEVYRFFKKLEVPSVDFLARDGNHTHLPYKKESFDTVEYGKWLSDLFNVYIHDEEPVRIRVLDDMTKLIIGGRTTKEGMGINNFGIIVIDTDGSITKNDTLKSSFDRADRFIEEWSVYNHFISEIVKTEEYQNYHNMQRPTNTMCKSCEYLNVCGGGMVVHRFKENSGFDNPTVFCNDNKYLIKHISEKVEKMLKDMVV